MMKKFLTVLVLGLAIFAVSCGDDDSKLSTDETTFVEAVSTKELNTTSTPTLSSVLTDASTAFTSPTKLTFANGGQSFTLATDSATLATFSFEVGGETATPATKGIYKVTVADGVSGAVEGSYVATVTISSAGAIEAVTIETVIDLTSANYKALIADAASGLAESTGLNVTFNTDESTTKTAFTTAAQGLVNNNFSSMITASVTDWGTVSSWAQNGTVAGATVTLTADSGYIFSDGSSTQTVVTGTTTLK